MRTPLESVGIRIIRYGLVLVLFWIGGMKFTAYEAEGILRLSHWTASYSVTAIR